MSAHPGPPRRPYLLRAMHQWITDSGHTPHVIVDASRPGVQVPAAYVRDGRIVLNIAYGATDGLDIGNDWLAFGARFGGVVHQVRVPVSAVLGVYARETGEGMVFAGEGDTGEPDPDSPPSPEPPGTRPGGPAGPAAGPGSGAAARRAKLKLVK